MGIKGILDKIKFQIKFLKCKAYPKLVNISFKRIDGDIISYQDLFLKILKRIKLHELPLIEPNIEREEDANTIPSIHDDHELINRAFTERTGSDKHE
jgi:hypothetical protein